MQRLINAIRAFFGRQSMSNENGNQNFGLHNSHVFEYLDYYLSFPHAPHYGVLLDGPWGIGKTYLVKRYLQHKFGEDRDKYVYISLFGLSSLDEIDDALYASAHPFLTSKGMKVAGKLAKAVLKFKDIDVDLDFDIKDFLSKRSNNVFIFDDLERADMDVNEVLGYINEFVEHDGCKVIIVANEDEIENQDEYLRKKEKIVGKTLRVESSLDEALNHFIGQIDNSKAKDFLTTKKGLITVVYYSSGLDNLRILQQSLWDFQRLYGAMTEKHRANESAVDACLQLFLPLSIAFKAGQLSDKDLVDRPSRLMAAMREQHPGAGPDNSIYDLQKNYTSINLYDTTLSNEVLEDVLSKGIIPTKKIEECLENSAFFATIDKEPAWRTVWFYVERTEEEFNHALKEMEEQFLAREFLEIGEISHVFGLRIWLASLQFIDKTKEDVVKEGKNYVDDLFERKLLKPTVDRFSSNDRLDSYAGLGVYENNTEEFRELFSYLNKKQIEMAEQQLPSEAKYVLNLIAKGNDEFSKEACLPPDMKGGGNYYNKEVMAKIVPDEFVSTLLKLHPIRQKYVLLALNTRYAHGHLERNLPNEKPWVEAVKEAIEKTRQNKNPSEAYRLGKVIEWYIDPILKPEQN